MHSALDGWIRRDRLMLKEGLQYVKGVGPRRAELLSKNGIKNCRDLLYHFPRRYLDRSTISYVSDLQPDGEEVTLVGTVRSIDVPSSGRRARLEAFLEDERGGLMKLVWFNGIPWIQRSLQMGDRLAVSGKVQRYGRLYSMVHPEMDKLATKLPPMSTGRILALYPGTAQLQRFGLTSRTFRGIIFGLLSTRGTELPEEILPQWLVEEWGLLNWRTSLRAMHLPKSQQELKQARTRLKFEELFLLQLMLLLYRRKRVQLTAVRLEGRNELLGRFIRSLPFTLTRGQEEALEEIGRDVSQGFQMSRLLQGDVGSGKTVVAVAALLLAVGADYQGAIMAPTEVLAEQHYKTLSAMLEPLGVHVQYLVGGQRKRLRDAALAEILNGYAQIVVGTHAVFQERVQFKNLALAVIDEQHRFGVKQRAALQSKGENPHILLMTATPIPRSLALTTYGDLDLSLIKELPAGRQPIKTRLLGEKRRSQMLAYILHELENGRQAYVIYPQIEKSEATDLKDAETGFRKLAQEFRDYQVDLVHGKMSSEDKEAAMRKFADGETQVLVATTVIEVGIDTPNATLIVIEHAERFGLSQLHQLRGRVGRGKHASYCILMADYRRTPEAKERLRTLTQTTDGFKISDKDLEIRGSGDFFGTRQHGLPSLKVADVAEDGKLLEQARATAERLVEQDADLERPEHELLRWYFTEFVQDGAGGLIRIG